MNDFSPIAAPLRRRRLSASPTDGKPLLRFAHACAPAGAQTTPELYLDVCGYIEETNRAASPEQVFDLFRRAVHAFGYDKVAFAAVTSAAQRAVASLLPRPALVVSCPQAWIDHYQASRYQDIDPCLLQAPTRLRPYGWAEAAAGDGLSARQKTLFAEARDAGLSDGLCIPVHGPAGESYVVSLSGSAKATDTAAHLGTLQILATQLQLAYTALARSGALQPAVHLSDRERECLTWTARQERLVDQPDPVSVGAHGALPSQRRYEENRRRQPGTGGRDRDPPGAHRPVAAGAGRRKPRRETENG